jgi:hypothetical protein
MQETLLKWKIAYLKKAGSVRIVNLQRERRETVQMATVLSSLRQYQNFRRAQRMRAEQLVSKRRFDTLNTAMRGLKEYLRHRQEKQAVYFKALEAH